MVAGRHRSAADLPACRARLVVVYVAVALAFGVVLGPVAGWDLGGQYFAGYVVEKSLSIDNLFVFVVIIATFSVPRRQQPRR